MIGLQSPRVLVVDDDFKEAKPILDGLWRCGIPAIYCDGESLPERPLKGLRLVFLDLHLSASTSAHTQIQNTVGVLRRLIDIDDGAIGILLWTKHPDHEADFKQALDERLPSFRPAFIVRSDRIAPQGGKVDAVTGQTPVEELFVNIAAALEEQPAHWLLRAWEQQVHDAVCSTVSTVVNSKASDALSLQAHLSQSAGAAESESQSLAALFGGLHQVLSDSIDQISEEVASSTAAKALWTLVQSNAKVKPDPDDQGVLNGFLLTSRVTPDDKRALPGSIYNVDTIDDPSISKLEKKEIRACLYKLFPESQRTDIRRVAEQCIALLIEITPSCDAAHAGKRSQLRLIGGLLFPHKPDEFPSMRDKWGMMSIAAGARDTVRQLPPFTHIDTGFGESPVSLIVCARFVYTRTLTWAESQQPMFRIREPVVADLQAWFAAHAARPGYYAV